MMKTSYRQMKLRKSIGTTTTRTGKYLKVIDLVEYGRRQSQNVHKAVYVDDMDRFDQLADSIQTNGTMYRYNIGEGYGMLRLV